MVVLEVPDIFIVYFCLKTAIALKFNVPVADKLPIFVFILGKNAYNMLDYRVRHVTTNQNDNIFQII